MKHKQNGEWVEVPATLETIEREIFGLRYEVKDLKNILFKQHQEREERKEFWKDMVIIILGIGVFFLAIIGAFAIARGFITL